MAFFVTANLKDMDRAFPSTYFRLSVMFLSFFLKQKMLLRLLFLHNFVTKYAFDIKFAGFGVKKNSGQKSEITNI